MHLKSLLAAAGSACPLNHLARRHVEAAVARPASPRSKDTYLRAIRSLVRWGVAKGGRAGDVTEAVEIAPGPLQMRPYLQPEEVARFLAACSPPLRVRAGVILAAGLRAAEAAHLRWSWIQGEDRPYIRIPARDDETGFLAKGRRVRPIPLSAEAQRCLAEAEALWGRTGYVLRNEPKAPRTSNWCKDAHEAARRAGVTDVDTRGLCRTAGARWFAAGLDIYEISYLLGHASVTTTERAYVGIATTTLRASIDKVDRWDAAHAATHGLFRAP